MTSRALLVFCRFVKFCSATYIKHYVCRSLKYKLTVHN